jgi:hypothetical protein
MVAFFLITMYSESDIHRKWTEVKAFGNQLLRIFRWLIDPVSPESRRPPLIAGVCMGRDAFQKFGTSKVGALESREGLFVPFESIRHNLQSDIRRRQSRIPGSLIVD